MWNKLFKKKQSKTTNKSASDATKPEPKGCFSFRKGNSCDKDFYKFEQGNHFLQFESEIYSKPGEVIAAKCCLSYRDSQGLMEGAQPT